MSDEARIGPDTTQPGDTFIRLDEAPGCRSGWGPGGCSYTGGCYCEREANHPGRCRCTCGRRWKRDPKHRVETVSHA
jgi:hypothetical protein